MLEWFRQWLEVDQDPNDDDFTGDTQQQESVAEESQAMHLFFFGAARKGTADLPGDDAEMKDGCCHDVIPAQR